MTTRPPYTDCQPGEPPTGFDLVELKYDGWFAVATIDSGTCTFVSQTGRVIERRLVSRDLPTMTLVGELLRGTTWACETGRTGQFVVYDALYIDWAELSRKPLHARRRTLERLFADQPLPEAFQLIEQYPFQAWQELWKERVETEDFEGLVFKSSTGSYGEPHARMKRTVTAEYVCMGANPGSGRYADVAASIRGGLFVDGKLKQVISVGGLTDELRRAVWEEPARFVGKVFEAAGKALFSSGALRHPAFLRWRPDKPASQCAA